MNYDGLDRDQKPKQTQLLFRTIVLNIINLERLILIYNVGTFRKHS